MDLYYNVKKMKTGCMNNEIEYFLFSKYETTI